MEMMKKWGIEMSERMVRVVWMIPSFQVTVPSYFPRFSSRKEMLADRIGPLTDAIYSQIYSALLQLTGGTESWSAPMYLLIDARLPWWSDDIDSWSGTRHSWIGATEPYLTAAIYVLIVAIALPVGFAQLKSTFCKMISSPVSQPE